jgi:hypothetical protein
LSAVSGSQLAVSRDKAATVAPHHDLVGLAITSAPRCSLKEARCYQQKNRKLSDDIENGARISVGHFWPEHGGGFRGCG